MCLENNYDIVMHKSHVLCSIHQRHLPLSPASLLPQVLNEHAILDADNQLFDAHCVRQFFKCDEHTNSKSTKHTKI